MWPDWRMRLILALMFSGLVAAEPLPPGYTIPIVDISGETQRQVVVDREAGQYLGHPTTVLLEDGKTILCVYPKGHGKGALVLKRSSDGGLTWSDRLPVPENWATSLETPTIHRVVDAGGRKRLIVWSGLFPARLAVSEDDGVNWTPLKSGWRLGRHRGDGIGRAGARQAGALSRAVSRRRALTFPPLRTRRNRP